MRIRFSLGCRGLCLILLGAFGASLLFAQNTGAPVVWQDSKLSVQFDNAAISQILGSIASTTGIKLTIDPSVANYRESVSFRGLPLRDAILEVLEGSQIDYIIVGTSRVSRGVQQVLLLGYSPKGPVTSPVSSVPVAQAGQNQQPNPFATATSPGGFDGRTMTGQPGPAQGRGSGRFLPFPEAGETSNTTNNPAQPGERVVSPNPFNPNPAASPANPTPENQLPVPDRRKPGSSPP